MIDFALIRRVMDQVTAFFAGPFLEAVRRGIEAMAEYRRVLDQVNETMATTPDQAQALVEANPLDSAIRRRRLTGDPAVEITLYTAGEEIPDPFPGIPEVDGSGYARQNPQEAP